MTPPRRPLAALLLTAILVGACGSDPVPTPSPAGPHGSVAPEGAALPTERPYRRSAWPADGSACDEPGYAGLLGRVQAVATRTVRFTLCRADGAFPARLAHPSLGVLDAAAVEAVAADPSLAHGVSGAGDFRVETWTPGGDVLLARVGATPSAAPGTAAPGSEAPSAPAAPARIVLRWGDDAAVRTTALREAAVDGIDAPSDADVDAMATLPELAVVPRPGLATAYLGFGAGRPFGSTAVRRAFAQALDRDALVEAAFPAGSTVASHLAPCEVEGGCGGPDWYATNGPAATDALATAKVDRDVPVVLHLPDAPVPGIPDPAALGAAIRDQLLESVGVTVTLDPIPAAELAAAVADGSLGGLYLAGLETILADPSGFLEPLFGAGATGPAAERAKGVAAELERAATSSDPERRAAAFAAANEAVRSTAAVVPIAHAGTTAAYRSDVRGVAVSPIGTDPLGTLVPGDRGQLVVMGATEPAGAWCGMDGSLDALRLCALTTPGLLAFDGASLDVVPALATRCTSTDGAVTWTCRLGDGQAYADGAAVDASDVVASVRAQAAAAGPLRAALPAEAFAAWDALFGGPVPGR